MPSMSASSVPSVSGSPSSMEMRLSEEQHSPHLSPSSHAHTLSSNLSPQPLCQPAASGFQWVSEGGVSLLYPTNVYSKSVFIRVSGRFKQLSCVQGEDDVPPRPPLPQLYSHDENPPAVPPLPRETTVIRHTSVRGLKRQSDERKRDREIGQDSKVERRGGGGGGGCRRRHLICVWLSG